MAKLHITQDDHYYWMLSHEGDDGALTLVAHQFGSPAKPLELAQELVAEGRFHGEITMDSPREASPAAAVHPSPVAGSMSRPSPEGRCVMALGTGSLTVRARTSRAVVPDGNTPIPTALVRWIRAKGRPNLIVYGGDVYPSGSSKSFNEFFNQMDRDVRLMCETPGNHDWKDDPNLPSVGRIPHGYDTFWRAHPESAQPIDMAKKGAARNEHFIDIEGWRLFFVDTGDYNTAAWPAGDASRLTWLRSHLNPGRANILFAHHSRLSRGRHGNNGKLDALWQALFDADGTPRFAFTMGGHDHNVSVYGPRSREDPENTSVEFAKGVHVFVNGAGGDGHYSQKDALRLLLLVRGERPDIFADDDHYFVTRINLISATAVDVDMLDFGKHAAADPIDVSASLVKIRL